MKLKRIFPLILCCVVIGCSTNDKKLAEAYDPTDYFFPVTNCLLKPDQVRKLTSLSSSGALSCPEIGLHKSKLKQMEKYLTKHPSKWQNQYSPEFKRHVCNEFLTGTLTRKAVEQKFKLGNSRLNFWLKELGYDCTKLRFIPLEIMAKSEQSKSTENETVEKLKKELEDAKLLAETYRRIIEKAEEELKISIRKKSNTK
jgi:hypothetical protein